MSRSVVLTIFFSQKKQNPPMSAARDMSTALNWCSCLMFYRYSLNQLWNSAQYYF